MLRTNPFRLIAILLVLLLLSLTAAAQGDYNTPGWLPQKENHLVYDYSGILSGEQRETLEKRLQDFNDSTSNQIVVMITPGFGGNDISSFAFEVGDKWGIGQKSLSNGVIIVVKPKDATSGEVEIAPGMGLEGALPDIFCKRIIEDQMIPRFREDDYYGGIVDALDVIMPVCAGEYNYEKYKEDHEASPWAILIFLGIIGIVVWIGTRREGSGGGGGHLSGGSFNGGTYYGGSSWSSWGGSSGSSRGGFGGFGGGSFGGGGASGRW